MLIINSIKNICYKLKLIMKTNMSKYSLVGIFVLLFTSAFFYEGNNNDVTTADVLYKLIKGDLVLKANNLNNILNDSGGQYFYMFSPSIAVLPFLIFYVSENKDRFNIYQFTREKKKRYIIESYITCALSSFILIITAMSFYDIVFIVMYRGMKFNILELLLHNVLSALSNSLSAIMQLMIAGVVYNVFSTVGLFFTINYYLAVASQKAIISNGSKWIICLPDQMIAYYNRAPLMQNYIIYIVIIKVILIIIIEIINSHLKRN